MLALTFSICSGSFPREAAPQVKQAQEDVNDVFLRFYAARKVIFVHQYFHLKIYCAKMYHFRKN